jgi:hypothetical protein
MSDEENVKKIKELIKPWTPFLTIIPKDGDYVIATTNLDEKEALEMVLDCAQKMIERDL